MHLYTQTLINSREILLFKSIAPSFPEILLTQDEQELADRIRKINRLHLDMLLQPITTQLLRDQIAKCERKLVCFHCVHTVSANTTGLVIGKWVQITNLLRDEFGTVDRVEKISDNNKFIYIKDFLTGATFKRLPCHLRRLSMQDVTQLNTPLP